MHKQSTMRQNTNTNVTGFILCGPCCISRPDYFLQLAWDLSLGVLSTPRETPLVTTKFSFSSGYNLGQSLGWGWKLVSTPISVLRSHLAWACAGSVGAASASECTCASILLASEDRISLTLTTPLALNDFSTSSSASFPEPSDERFDENKTSH